MKKAFDQNVSRAKPRLRLGGLTGVVETTPEPEAPVAVETAPVIPDLASTVKARVEQARAPKPTASEAVQRALDSVAHEMVEQIAMNVAAEPPLSVRSRPTPQPEVMPVATVKEVVHAVATQTVAAAEPPPSLVEVQTPPAPIHADELAPELRREKLKERLKAVRENPRPEPLPATVAETGVRAVERISSLQTEVAKLKTLNLALTQDLEAARRTAEKATEEARSRMEEAQRLTKQMEERALLLSELERELSALEGERDESLLKLQEARQSLEAGAKEQAELRGIIAERDRALADSLSEEEKLAAELEAAHEDASSLRRALDAVNQERDTLARQVSELTAERAELLEARRALEAVHRALSQAAAAR